MTFTRWIRKQWRRDDPVEDLARDVRADRCGRKARTLAGWQRHLEAHNACYGVLLALDQAFAEWKKEVRTRDWLREITA
jgi:hypothetical protein